MEVILVYKPTYNWGGPILHHSMSFFVPFLWLHDLTAGPAMLCNSLRAPGFLHCAGSYLTSNSTADSEEKSKQPTKIQSITIITCVWSIPLRHTDVRVLSWPHCSKSDTLFLFKHSHQILIDTIYIYKCVSYQSLKRLKHISRIA